MRAIEIIKNSKITHEEWRDYFRKNPGVQLKEEYKHLGDAEFQAKCVRDYEEAIKEIEQLQAELAKAKKQFEKMKEIYNEIFENFIPLDKMDEANDKLVLLLVGDREQMGRDLLKRHPLKGERDE